MTKYMEIAANEMKIGKEYGKINEIAIFYSSRELQIQDLIWILM